MISTPSYHDWSFLDKLILPFIGEIAETRCMIHLKKRLIVFFSALAILAAAILIHFVFKDSTRSQKIIIGAKNCTEQHILSEIMAQLLEEHTDLEVMRKFTLDNTFICFHALLSGDIDLYSEYTGTALLGILKQDLIQSDSYGFVKEEFETRYDLIWLAPFGFNNTYALLMNESLAKRLGIRTISELKPHQLKIAFDPEFYARAEKQSLEKAYRLNFSKVQQMDHALLYLSLQNQSIELMNGYSTDGFIFAYQLQVLEDEKHALPSYHAAPVIRKITLRKYPQIEEVLGKLRGRISTQQMQLMNYEVEKKGKIVHDVARNFLVLEKLVEF